MKNENNQKTVFGGFMVKLDRLAAWVLLVVILLYALTGYGLTRGLMDRSLARSLHSNWLGAVGLVAFVIHVGWATRLALMRWKMWNVFSKTILAIFFLLLIAFFIYIHFFYKNA